MGYVYNHLFVTFASICTPQSYPTPHPPAPNAPGIAAVPGVPVSLGPPGPNLCLSLAVGLATDTHQLSGLVAGLIVRLWNIFHNLCMAFAVYHAGFLLSSLRFRLDPRQEFPGDRGRMQGKSAGSLAASRWGKRKSRCSMTGLGSWQSTGRSRSTFQKIPWNFSPTKHMNRLANYESKSRTT